MNIFYSFLLSNIFIDKYAHQSPLFFSNEKKLGFTVLSCIPKVVRAFKLHFYNQSFLNKSFPLGKSGPTEHGRESKFVRRLMTSRRRLFYLRSRRIGISDHGLMMFGIFSVFLIIVINFSFVWEIPVKHVIEGLVSFQRMENTLHF